MFMKRLLGTLGIILLTLILIPIAEAQEQGARERIRIAYGANSISFLVMFLANDLGFYAQNRMEAELIMVGPSAGMAALLGGDIDYVELLSGTIRLAAKEGPVRAVSTTQRILLSMVARSQYKEVKELNGKIVGVSFLGGLHQLSAKKLLQHFGVDPERQAKIIPIGDQKLLYQALKKEIYQTAVEMHERFSALLRPGITTHDLARWRPRPGENFKTPEQIKKGRATWSNHFGGMGIAWDSAPNCRTVEDPEIVLEKNMTIAYHALFCVEGEAGGVAIENTYSITDTGCEAMTKWPYEDIMVLGL